MSGGALVPAKMWHGLVDFEFNDGEWNYKENLAEEQISIYDLNGNKTQLQILEPHDTNKMLGVFLAIDGNNVTQIAHMIRVADKWYEKVR